jgi:hypothetical protein
MVLSPGTKFTINIPVGIESSSKLALVLDPIPASIFVVNK